MRVNFYYESKREAPKILTAHQFKPLLGYILFSDYVIEFGKELEYPREKRN